MLVLDTPVRSLAQQRDNITTDTPVPPEPQERFDPGEGPKTLFICASTIERCEEILDFIDKFSIDDIREKVRVVFCTHPDALDTQIMPVITAGVNRVAAICMRHDGLDSDAFLQVFAGSIVRILGPDMNRGDIVQVQEFLRIIITFAHSEDTKVSFKGTGRFSDEFMDLYLARKGQSRDLEYIFSDQRMIDLGNIKFGEKVRNIIGIRIRGGL